MTFSEKIKAEALRLGFSRYGITKAVPLDDLRTYYKHYIRAGSQGPLSYLETNTDKRLDPSLLMPGIKSVIALMMNYFPAETIPEEDNYIIAKYACGGDYHPLMKERLNQLAGFVSSLSPGAETRAFVDSGPVLEKTWAQRTGLGWQGKNTLVINKNLGSFFFIGILFTTLGMEPDQPETNHCGTCTRCMKACPTGALDTPYQLNIPKCISFHTIETKEAIPMEIRNNLKGRIYGCDICQDVCPFNRFAAPATEPAFAPSEELMAMRKKDWEELTAEQFNRIFRNSSVKRTGYEKLVRNISDSKLS